MEPGWLLVPRVAVLWVLLAGVWGQGHDVYQTPRTVSVEFGHDVNLTCRPDLDDVFWYMEASGRIRVAILRTFNKKVSTLDLFVYASDTNKYSTLAGNVLVIHNVGAEDCMVYYCGHKNNFTNEFHLLPVSTATRLTNQSEPQFWERR
ncbi:hypothetical protein CRUP_026366 [Coryphaenoides rupestris]|nr:hypothetical protein CRUP_026366 [Coryphaenoides rupestris]